MKVRVHAVGWLLKDIFHTFFSCYVRDSSCSLTQQDTVLYPGISTTSNIKTYGARHWARHTNTHKNASVTAELSHLKGHRDFSISSRKHVVRFSCREWKGCAALSFVVATRRTSVSIMENIIYRQRDFLLFNFNAEAHGPQTTNSRACDATLRSRRIQRQ